jgi:hypothetical protein
MQKPKYPWRWLFLTALLLVFGFVALERVVKERQLYQKKAATSETPFVVREDSTLGHIFIENDQIAVVWHYKYIPSENYNQGGGNIYELTIRELIL